MMNEQALTIQRLEAKIAKYQNGHVTHGPLDQTISPLERATAHKFLLGIVYGYGHPAMKQPIESLISDQQEGRILTWLLYHKGQAVGMANIQMQDGIAEFFRTGKVPVGTKLMDKTILEDEVNNTSVMYQRFVDFLNMPEALNSVYALQADLRLAADIPLNDGKKITSGAKTQHINAEAGFKPFLLCVPRYQVTPKNRPPHQEAFFQSRIYTQPENVHLDPIYTPPTNAKGRITIADIAKTTYESAFPDRSTDSLIHTEYSGKTQPGTISIEENGGEQYSTVKASGSVSPVDLQRAVQTALTQSNFAEIIIESRPENIITQEIAYKLGLIPLGVIPGGDFTIQNSTVHVPTTIHFGMARPEIRRQIVDIELAREYKDTPIEQLTKALHQAWKTL